MLFSNIRNTAQDKLFTDQELLSGRYNVQCASGQQKRAICLSSPLPVVRNKKLTYSTSLDILAVASLLVWADPTIKFRSDQCGHWSSIISGFSMTIQCFGDSLVKGQVVPVRALGMSRSEQAQARPKLCFCQHWADGWPCIQTPSDVWLS